MDDGTYQVGALRKPLTAAQNNELIERLYDGEDVMEEIILGNFRWLVSIAKKYAGAYSVDDLVQEAVVVAMRVVWSYDSDKGSFATFLYSCVRNRIIALIVPRIKMNAIRMSGGEDWERTVHVVDHERLDHIEMADKMVRSIREEIDRIIPDDQDRMVFSLSHGLLDGKCRSQQEVAAIIGLPRLDIRDILNRTTEEVRSNYGEEIKEAVRGQWEGVQRTCLFSSTGSKMFRGLGPGMEYGVEQTGS